MGNTTKRGLWCFLQSSLKNDLASEAKDLKFAPDYLFLKELFKYTHTVLDNNSVLLGKKANVQMN